MVSQKIDIRPCDATLGAVVRGVNLAALDDATFKLVLDAWHRYAVLVFPEQHLDDDAHVAFSERFGALERSLTSNLVGVHPAVINLTNVRGDGSLDAPDHKRAVFNSGNQVWHTDSSFKRVPAKGSVLRACRVPDSGGETAFADMRAAFDGLDPGMVERLEDKIAVHSYIYSQGRIGGLELMSRAERDALPPVQHRVLRTHPETGRTSLYVGRHASHIVGEDVEASRALLESLVAHACQAPRIYTHRWNVGDVVMWDNRCVLHRGYASPADQAREMRRTTIAGEPGDATDLSPDALADDVLKHEWALAER